MPWVADVRSGSRLCENVREAMSRRKEFYIAHISRDIANIIGRFIDEIEKTFL